MMGAKEIAELLIDNGPLSSIIWADRNRIVTDYLRLRAENEALKDQQKSADARIVGQRAEINRLSGELTSSDRARRDNLKWRAECEQWNDPTSAFHQIDRLTSQIAELTRQMDEAQQDIADLKVDLSRTADCEDKALARAEAAESQNAAMREAIEKAEHPKTCRVAEWEVKLWAYGRGLRGCKHPGEKPACDCWKARALQPAPEPPSPNSPDPLILLK